MKKMKKHTKNPPKAGGLILRLLLKTEDYNEKSGDLEEVYYSLIEENGLIKAKTWYWSQVFKAVPVLLFNRLIWSFIMFRNYFTVAVRNIIKHKGYSFINTAGLAVGMASCILILLWVYDEISYDGFHENAESISRIIQEVHTSNEVSMEAGTSGKLGPMLKDEYPEVINFARVTPFNSLRIMKFGKKEFSGFEGVFADPSFFDIFSFLFLKGDSEILKENPGTIILTAKTAETIFGEKDPLGKVISIGNREQYTVAGVLKEIPSNSHLKFDFLISLEKLAGRGFPVEAWGWDIFSTYIQIRGNSSAKEVSQKISGFIKKHVSSSTKTISLQPLKKIHLHSDFKFDVKGQGDIKYIYIFILLAVLIIVIACINFINLATARSGNRSKEVGLRKVAGARRSDLIIQFLGESVLLSIGALFFAVMIVIISISYFSDFAGKDLSLSTMGVLEITLLLAGAGVFTGVLSGLYPALFLSSFQPAKTLKGVFKRGSSGSVFRKVLVVTQFSLSVFLIIFTLIISEQLEFIGNKKMGFNKDQLVYFPRNGGYRNNFDVIKNELLQNPDIICMANGYPPLINVRGTSEADWDGKNPGDEVLFQEFNVGYDYFKTLGMEITEGRSFSHEFSTDTSAYILNEAAVTAAGINSPVGRRFSFNGREGTIIGVVKDFHHNSLHKKIEPVVIKLGSNYLTFVKLRSGKITGTISYLEKKWKQIAPEYPFKLLFLDETVDELYRAEQRMGRIFNSFSILAILISCLGLLGLASYMAEQKTKEIGIRKTLGATSQGIVLLLSRELVIWVLYANIIAWPAAWFAGNGWLQDFAYRTDLSILTFAVSGLLALGTALATVIFQTVKAAMANPVDSLKYE